jgi:hypothetical protein
MLEKVAIFMFSPKQTDENSVQNMSCVGRRGGKLSPLLLVRDAKKNLLVIFIVIQFVEKIV